jgi:hypothetical protein
LHQGTILAGFFLGLVCGCGDAYEHVTYDPPPIEGPFRTIAIDGTGGATEPDAVVPIPFDGPVKRDAALAFVGRYQPSGPFSAPPVVASFYSRDRSGARVTLTSAIGEWEEDADGLFIYRIEIRAPAIAAHCEVEVITVESTLARGNVDIE